MKKLLTIAISAFSLMLLSFSVNKFIELTPTNVGEIHNKLLDEIALKTKSPSTLGQIQNFDEYKGIVQNYYVANNIRYTLNIGLTEFRNCISQIKDRTIFENLYTSGKISLKVKTSIDEFFRLLNSTEDYNTLKQLIASYESKISTFGLNRSETDLIVGMVSVAKSSALFWNSASNNPNSPWYRQSVLTNSNNGINDIDLAKNTSAKEYSKSHSSFNSFPTLLIQYDHLNNAYRVKWWKLLGDVAGFVAGNALGGPAGGVGLGGLVSACIE